MHSDLTGRFGVEIELNSFDCRDFVENPLVRGEKPYGMDKVAEKLSRIGFECEVHDWQYNHNPSCWSCKPDSSCGIELCSPVMDLNSKHKLSEVLNCIKDDSEIPVDHRCSIHVHLELSSTEATHAAASILAWWIKCEHVFLDFADPSRKNNYYCKPIGLTDIIDSKDEVSATQLLKKLSKKHFSANSFHFFNKKRSTLEFRLGEGTKDANFVNMWIDVLLNFSQQACLNGLPSNYLWISPEEVIEFMRMDESLKIWFISRLTQNTRFNSSEYFSIENRKHAILYYESIKI